MAMERLDKEMTCEICISQYKDPKILPCLHIYCKSCLVDRATKVEQEKEYLTCPRCKSVHKIPPQGIDGFKTYLVINTLLELLHIHDVTVRTNELQCESGLDENPAFARCLSCTEYLCMSCFNLHQKLTATKHHSVLTLDKIRQSDKTLWMEHLKKRLHFCGKHEQEVLKLYCKTCKEVICRDCALVKHRVHDYVFLREVCPDMQNGIETQLKEMHKKKEEFENHKKHIKSVGTANKEAINSSLKEVNENCDKVIEAIEARRAALVANFHSVHEAENEQHEERKKCLDHSTAQFSDSIQFTHNLLSRDDDVEIMTMGQQAMANLTRLTKVAFDKEASKPSLLRLKFSDVMLKPRFENIVSDIVIENVPTHALVNEEASFTCMIKVSDSIRHFDATPLLSVTIKVIYNNEDIPIKILSRGLNQWRVKLSKNPCKSGLYTIEVKLGETTSITERHTFTVHKLSFYELRKKFQTTYHPQRR